MKRFTPIPAALICALGLASCGKESGISVSVDKFEDDGIAWINIYAGEYRDGNEDKTQMNGLRSFGVCYNNQQEKKLYTDVKLDEGTWYGFVSIYLHDGYYIEGDITTDNLKLEINGEERVFVSNRIEGVNTPFDGDYWAEIGEFSSDTVIKLKGSTTLKTYKPRITIKDYDSYGNLEVCKGLIFKYAKNNGSYSKELSANELKEYIESQTPTYYDVYEVTTYFKNKDKFFPEQNSLNEFINFNESLGVSILSWSDDLEVKWKFEYPSSGSASVTLNYSVFKDMDINQMQYVTLERHIYDDFVEKYGRILDDDNWKFIVDNTEKDILTISEHRMAKNLKIRFAISDDCYNTLQENDDIIIATVYPYPGYHKDTINKFFSKKEFILEENSGKKYLILDFGDFKTYDEERPLLFKYTTIELHILLQEMIEGYSL